MMFFQSIALALSPLFSTTQYDNMSIVRVRIENQEQLILLQNHGARSLACFDHTGSTPMIFDETLIELAQKMQIDFEKLLENYNNELVTKLRSFNDQYNYLQYWVPDSDKTTSLLNLVDALYETGTLNFSLLILQTSQLCLDPEDTVQHK